MALYEGTLRKHNKSASGLALSGLQLQKGIADLGHTRKAFGKVNYSEVYEPLLILGG